MEEGNVGGEMGGEEKRESSGHSASARPDAPCSAKHAVPGSVCQSGGYVFFETRGMEANREGGSEVTSDHRRTRRREM